MQSNNENQPKCKYCYDKGYYSVFKGEIGYDDFGGEGYEELPEIKNVPCPRCNQSKDEEKEHDTYNGDVISDRWEDIIMKRQVSWAFGETAALEDIIAVHDREWILQFIRSLLQSERERIIKIIYDELYLQPINQDGEMVKESLYRILKYIKNETTT